ncbi:MAG: hypothetical protein P8J86_07610 [Phycisphaerales bacterium]|nr:hypothetical protein [Phycisphaerales bacterium]
MPRPDQNPRKRNPPLPDPSRIYRVSCAPGLSPWLSREIESLGLKVSGTDHTGVTTTGTWTDAMRMCLRLRTAYHVLQRFADIQAVDAEMLYQESVRLPWERIISPDGYVSVISAVQNSTIDNSMFPNMRLKDAIVDRIQEVHGRRPNAGSDRTQSVIHLYWKDDQARISLDLAGQKLSDRGYRRIPFLAPMRETIAAAVLLETGYDGSRPLVIPMCGSGTLAIEGALLATQRAPGLLRSNFGMQHLLTFDEMQWKQERVNARKATLKNAPAPIIATDIDPHAVMAAKKNAATAGVEHLIEFHVCDFAETPMPETPGTIILHGEYGERLGDLLKLKDVYKRVGDFLKQSCPGWDGFVFTSHDLAGTIGLKTARRVPFENGGVECRLLRYKLFKGTAKPPIEAGK